MALACTCSCPLSQLFTCFADTPAENSLEVLCVSPGVDPSLAVSQHSPCLVGGIRTHLDACLATKVAINS